MSLVSWACPGALDHSPAPWDFNPELPHPCSGVWGTLNGGRATTGTGGLLSPARSKVFLTVTRLYFSAEEGGERSVCRTFAFRFLLLAMLVQVVREETLELGLEPGTCSLGPGGATSITPLCELTKVGFKWLFYLHAVGEGRDPWGPEQSPWVLATLDAPLGFEDKRISCLTVSDRCLWL